MFERFRDNFFNFINSRLIVLTLVVLLMGGVLIHRVFVLQIVNGENYLNEFSLKIKRNAPFPAPGARFSTGTASFLPTMILLTP